MKKNTFNLPIGTQVTHTNGNWTGYINNNHDGEKVIIVLDEHFQISKQIPLTDGYIDEFEITGSIFGMIQDEYSENQRRLEKATKVYHQKMVSFQETNSKLNDLLGRFNDNFTKDLHEMYPVKKNLYRVVYDVFDFMNNYVGSRSIDIEAESEDEAIDKYIREVEHIDGKLLNNIVKLDERTMTKDE